jgi:hypothetical protein
MNKVFVVISSLLFLLFFFSCLSYKNSKKRIIETSTENSSLDTTAYYLIDNNKLLIKKGGQIEYLSTKKMSCDHCSAEEIEYYNHFVYTLSPITGTKTGRIYYMIDKYRLVSGKDTFDRRDSLFWQIQ